MVSPSPTERLLLTAASLDSEGRDERVRQAEREGIDWRHLLALARHNRVVPLLYLALRSAGLEETLLAEAPHFEEFKRHHKKQNLRLYCEMWGIARDLRARGIEVVPYKGPFLSLTVYGDLGTRQFYDLDLIVRQRDVAAAQAVLLERGYHRVGSTEASLEHVVATDCELHFRPPHGDPLVELHWNVLPPRHGYGVDMSDIWPRLVRTEMKLAATGALQDDAVDVLTFTPEDLLLVLSVHAGDKHRWGRIQMVADVARVLSVHPDLDWDVLLERARALGRESVVLQGVLLAWALQEAPLPDAIASRALASDEIRTGAALAVGRQLRLDSGLPTYDQWRAYGELIDTGAREQGVNASRRSSFLSYLRAAATPEWTDRQALALPPALDLFYYVYRPWRLWRKHKGALFRRI